MHDPLPNPRALNPGIGIQATYAEDFVRTSVAAGPSVLLVNTPLDPAGSMGFFVDIRPNGLRWDLTEELVIGLDPLSFALVVPAIQGIPLVRVEYRTVLQTEYRW